MRYKQKRKVIQSSTLSGVDIKLEEILNEYSDWKIVSSCPYEGGIEYVLEQDNFEEPIGDPGDDILKKMFELLSQASPEK